MGEGCCDLQPTSSARVLSPVRGEGTGSGGLAGSLGGFSQFGLPGQQKLCACSYWVSRSKPRSAMRDLLGCFGLFVFLKSNHSSSPG